MLDLQTPVQFVKGIGPRRAQELALKNILTVEDLLYHLPYRYEDRTNFCNVIDLQPGEKTSILVEVMTTGLNITARNRLRIFELAGRDETAVIRCKWFHSEYLAQRKIFRKGQIVIFHGKFEVDRYGSGTLQVINPEFEILDQKINPSDSLEMGRIVPVYEAIKSCSSRVLRRAIYRCLLDLQQLPEILPAEVLNRHNLTNRKLALNESHFPSETTSLGDLAKKETPALQRLIFEELFLLEVGVRWKRQQHRTVPGIPFAIGLNIRETIKKILPFHPTNSQKKAFGELVSDMRQNIPMNRLLQGDVGCGKTIVAMEAIAIAVENGFQVGLMAPTEILAEQHFFYAKQLYTKLDYQIDLLKSGLRKKERAYLLEQLRKGNSQILIGTHALLQSDVEFKNLGLVIIDEQHRFGVLQRFNLMRKGTYPDTLVMTATPIPRTLSMTLYGDLDVSVIDEMPPNRTPIETRLLEEKERIFAYRLIEEQVQKGHQVYFLCPLIEESEKLDLKAATKTFEHLNNEIFPMFKVELLHGRLKSHEKDAIMCRFSSGATNILVSTTVVEVGVDVANATVMFIEHAERFGLAQLHQLRGRVGRGQNKSYCFLMQGSKTVTPEAHQRLSCLESTTNGFEIAEKDLEIRGPGEFFGTRQAGLPTLRVSNLLRDQKLLLKARKEAIYFVDNSSNRSNLRNMVQSLNNKWKKRYGLIGVG